MGLSEIGYPTPSTSPSQFSLLKLPFRSVSGVYRIFKHALMKCCWLYIQFYSHSDPIKSPLFMVKYRVESGYIILNAVKLPNANLLGRIFMIKVSNLRFLRVDPWTHWWQPVSYRTTEMRVSGKATLQ
jgi:hypothetical protein